MRIYILPLLLIVSALGLWAADPRPGILIVGDVNSTGFGFAPSWGVALGKMHPEWRIVVDAKDRLIGDLAAKPEDALATIDHVDAVLVFVGTREAAADKYKQADAAAVGKQMAEYLAALKANAKTTRARLCVITPVPVIDARLDQYSKAAFAGGEANSDAIAAAFAAAAHNAGVLVIDAHKLIKDDAADGKPGRLVGSIGWRVRDWGIPILTRMLEPEIVATVNPQPADPAAFAAWKAERVATRQLDFILAKTCAGTVTAGERLAAKPVAAKPAYDAVTIPADLLRGEAVSLLAMADDKPWAMIGTGGDRYAKPTLVVRCEDGDITIPIPDAEWQCIDEANPDKPVDPFLFRFNVVKERFAMGLRNEEGKRIWGLVRFPLEALAGKKVVSATAQLIPVGMVELNFGAADRRPLGGAVGGTAYYPVLGQDAQWDGDKATWKTRDGEIGWSGGVVNAPDRKAQLTAFLATNPPATVAARAKDELAKL